MKTIHPTVIERYLEHCHGYVDAEVLHVRSHQATSSLMYVEWQWRQGTTKKLMTGCVPHRELNNFLNPQVANIGVIE